MILELIIQNKILLRQKLVNLRIFSIQIDFICIADSTMEVNNVTTSKAAKEVVWLKKFLMGLGGSTLGYTTLGI